MRHGDPPIQSLCNIHSLDVYYIRVAFCHDLVLKYIISSYMEPQHSQIQNQSNLTPTKGAGDGESFRHAEVGGGVWGGGGTTSFEVVITLTQACQHSVNLSRYRCIKIWYIYTRNGTFFIFR